MESPRDKPHIVVTGSVSAEPFTPHSSGMTPSAAPSPPHRPTHGMNLRNALLSVRDAALDRRSTATVSVEGAQPGMYVEFVAGPDVQLALESLDARRYGIELVACPEGLGQVATVRVPDEQLKYFLKRLDKYAKDTPKGKGEQRHEKLFDPITEVRLATLRGLWTDDPDLFPADGEAIWWEVWLRRTDGNEVARLQSFATQLDLTVGPRRVGFEDRIVVLVRATPQQLSSSIDVLGDLAELQRAREAAAFFTNLTPREQIEWVRDLLERTQWPPDDAPRVCILDTGVSRTHPLLEPAISAHDCLTIDPNWGTADGPIGEDHGTRMAGLALFGDLTDPLASNAIVQVRHRLESVRVLPRFAPQNPPESWGAITAEAAAYAETNRPSARRTFLMAITTDGRDRGKPTSWSAAIDALAAGRSFDPNGASLVYFDAEETPARRLFVLSAGNASPQSAHFLDVCDSTAIHNPAQAWNALTVGAFTSKATLDPSEWPSIRPLAPPGDLSPWSSTSRPFDASWPIKPDIVMEGGNVAIDSQGMLGGGEPDLSLLTTHFQPGTKLLDLLWATSAASAQAARSAAIVSASYPSLWPESVRGLIVHGSEWNSVMRAHLPHQPTRQDKSRLLRRYGYGAPDAERVLRSASDALTLIAQDSIQPFDGGKMSQINFHRLPWPDEALREIGEESVRLRVTLSYFIEPNPSRRGQTTRFRYASHGLRFAIKGPTESLDEFRKALNRRALEEDERRPSGRKAGADWFFGEKARDKGSLHSDWLWTSAAELADRGVIAVYPVSGWWKDLPKRDRSRVGALYSLIVSIETEAVNVDLWTPVASLVGVPIATSIDN